MADKPVVTENSWQTLRQYTDARIGLGRAGISLPTQHHLKFQLDHARARDAVMRPVAWPGLVEGLAGLGADVVQLASRAPDRDTYLQRPDLGRALAEGSAQTLVEWRKHHNQPVDICIVLGDGLSATAVEDQALPFLQQFFQDLSPTSYQCPLITCVSQCRVGLGDDVAERVNAKYLVVLIGERPGLSAADSLGIYYTYLARRGCTDADRNCLSNVRPKGLSFKEASSKLLWLLQESDKRQLSGVKLKDDSNNAISLADDNTRNFLIPKL